MNVAKSRMVPRPLEASIVLFLAAEALVFVVIGDDSWPLVGAWAVAAAGVLLVARFASPWLRKALAVLLVAVCVLMTTQAGLFFLPAAIALLVAAFTHPHHAAATS